LLNYCFCIPQSFKCTCCPVLGVYPIIHVSLSRRTHQLIAEVTLNSKLSFCTATSMRATTSPESELAVSLIRSVHCWPALCIPAGQKSAKYRFVSNKILTLQTYKWWRSTKPGQITLLETSLHLGINLCFWMILERYLDVTLELVIFGE